MTLAPAKMPTTPSINVEHVKGLFPKRYHDNVESGYDVIEAQFKKSIDGINKGKVQITPSQQELLRTYMYATVRAENDRFEPHYDEQPNRLNSYIAPLQRSSLDPEGGTLVMRPRVVPFWKYQDAVRDKKHKLGNLSLEDAQTYYGRGYIQLTGKHQYSVFGPKAGIPDLLHNPDKASEPENAARLLVAYVLLEGNRKRILSALYEKKFEMARAVVNGGGHGARTFKHAFVKLLKATDPDPEGTKQRINDEIMKGPEVEAKERVEGVVT